jgi:hypothetical protein
MQEQNKKDRDPRVFVKNGRELRRKIVGLGYSHVREFCEKNGYNYQTFRQGIYGTMPACKPLLTQLKAHKLKPVLGGKP